jgi:hypothetical protein
LSQNAACWTLSPGLIIPDGFAQTVPRRERHP